MRIVDHTADVRTLVVVSLAALNRVLPCFRDATAAPSQVLDDAAPALIALVREIYQLRRFARLGAPHIDDLGGLGTGLDDSDAPSIMCATEGKESWDFQPWLAEKLQSAEGAIFRACDLCAPSCESQTWPSWRRVVHYDDPVAECRRLLEGARAYLTAMLDMLESGELRIHQLSASGPWDEEDAEG